MLELYGAAGAGAGLLLPLFSLEEGHATLIVPEVLIVQLCCMSQKLECMVYALFYNHNHGSEVSSLDSSWIRSILLLFSQLLHLTTHRLITGISNRPADSRKVKPGYHATVAE